MAGLPGVGKTTIAAALAVGHGSLLLSVDSIDDALSRAECDRGSIPGMAAYIVAEEIAAGNLKLGRSVVVDASNHLKVFRDMWVSLARRCESNVLFVEVVCSDLALHQGWLKVRNSQTPGKEVSFSEVVERFYESEPWQDEPRLMIDNLAGVSIAKVVEKVWQEVK